MRVGFFRFILTVTLISANLIITNKLFVSGIVRNCINDIHLFTIARFPSQLPHTSVSQDIILPVVLYGCETWALTLREERKLRVFENMVLRRIFGLRRDEVTGEWRGLHNEELNDLYSSPNIVRVIK